MQTEKQRLEVIWKAHLSKKKFGAKGVEKVQIVGATIVDINAKDPTDLGPLIQMDLPLFSKISMDDIQQTQIADCYFLAFLGGLAMTTKGQNYIRSIMYYDPSNLKQVVVQFIRNGLVTRLHCDLSISLNSNQLDQKDKDIWVEMFEKAYANFRIVNNISYHSLDYGSSINVAYDMGCVPSNMWIGPQTVAAELKKQFDAGLVITAPTMLTPGAGLVGNHMYWIVGFEGDAIILRNPWGIQYGLTHITPEQNIQNNIYGYCYATIPEVAGPVFTQADIDNAVSAEKLKIKNLLLKVNNNLN